MSYMRTTLLVSICCAFLLSASSSFCQELTGRDYVKRSDDLMRGDTQKGIYFMTVVTPQWERRLELSVRAKDRDKMLLKILNPAKEKGITTLRVKNEMWNYLPSVERTIKIPPSMMLQPWMGSDFANDDLVRESSVVDDYDHKITNELIFNGEPVVRIELTPKPTAGVVWSKRVMLIHKTTFVPVRDKFYGKNNTLIKILIYSKVRQVGDRAIPTHWEMVSEIKKGNRTTIEVDENLVYNESLDDSVFSLQSLKSS
jgi:outer membrane lipoprotein-sorting protein